MSIEQAMMKALRGMSPEAQRQVLDYAETIHRESNASGKQLKNPQGLWADLSVTIFEEDVASARREMWIAFPREIDP